MKDFFRYIILTTWFSAFHLFLIWVIHAVFNLDLVTAAVAFLVIDNMTRSRDEYINEMKGRP